jgi:hypothetical protein
MADQPENTAETEPRPPEDTAGSLVDRQATLNKLEEIDRQIA